MGEKRETIMGYAGLRIVAAVSLLGVAAAGAFVSGRTERSSRARLSAVRSGDAEVVGSPSATTSPSVDPTKFAEDAHNDATAFGIGDVSITTLAAAQPHVVAIAEPLVLAPGKRWSGHGIEIAASIEKATYSDRGATVSARHSVLTVTNASDRPLAYVLRATSAGPATCEVRGARMHNAMALLPRESAEIVVCAGTTKPKIVRLELLEISELGYYYVSQLPATAVGHDAITDRAHRPDAAITRCELDAKGIAHAIADGATRWVDVVDFFSRHNCHRYGFSRSYRRSDGPLDRLPAVPEP